MVGEGATPDRGLPPGWFAGDPEDAAARVTAWADGVQRRVSDAQRVAAEVEALRVTATGIRGAVTVEVDGAGRLSGLRFTAAADQFTLVQLATEVMAVHRRAQALLVQRTEELYGALSEIGPETGRAVATGLRRRLADTDPWDGLGGSHGESRSTGREEGRRGDGRHRAEEKGPDW
ncbi:MAG: YbaB/EbfC family nucleoid-associated protein [Kineosporiaceae bacterium]|jgi:hypothetical protein